MRRQAGFTLLEVLVALAITAAVLVPLAGLLQQATGAFTAGLDSVALQERLSLALARVGREVRSHREAAVQDEGRSLLLGGQGPAVTLALTPRPDGTWSLLRRGQEGEEVWLAGLAGGGFASEAGGAVRVSLTARQGKQELTLSTVVACRR